MKLLFVTATIIWSLTSANVSLCKGLTADHLDGCFKQQKHTITIEVNGVVISKEIINDGPGEIFVKEKTSRPKDFVFYHEIGHSLFNDKVNTGKSPFSNVENMAENFALYIYEYKYPNSFIKPKPKFDKFFKENCPKKCVDEIIGIKVPGMEYPIDPFSVRI